MKRKIWAIVLGSFLMLTGGVLSLHAAESGRCVPHYNVAEVGGDWDTFRYRLSDGTLVKDAFVFDGMHTYYVQSDGTPMKDRLTYHPDGEHIIYFDVNGHEVFNSLQYCPSERSIYYFDSNGYIYKDKITFIGDKVYYLNANGKMEQSGWFQFANGRDYGYANGDGTLNTSGFYYDPWGRIVYCHWNGMVARGLITDGTTYYNMDMTDGHLIGVFPANTEVKAHEHHWEAVNLTVRHPEQKYWTDQGHRETVLIKEAHEEPNMVVKWICKTCYFRDGIIVELPRDKEPSQDETYQQHFQYHWDRNDGLVQWGDVEVQDGMKWVPAMYTEEWIQNIVPVVYKEAKDEVITLYYKCSECGAVK